MKISNDRLREFNQNNANAVIGERKEYFEANVAALDRLAELEKLAERVEYKSEPGRCSIKVSESDEWGEYGKVEHVWQDGDLA